MSKSQGGALHLTAGTPDKRVDMQ